MIAMKDLPPLVQNPMTDMIMEAVRTALPTVHTQLNQFRLNSLQVRQAAIRATNKSIRSSLEADKQFFELVQAMLPIAYKQTSRMRLSLIEIHEALIKNMNQAMEQSLKTDQQLYDACLELLNNESEPGVTAEVVENEEEIEVEVIPDEEIVVEPTAEEN